MTSDSGYDRGGFGVSLSGDGDTALISAYNKTTTFASDGAAYEFTRSGGTWTQQNKIVSAEGFNNDTGAVYVFDNN